MSDNCCPWRPIVIWPSWGVCAASIALQAFVVPEATWWIYIPFTASVLVFGLPHGALDHLVVLHQREQRPAVGTLGRVVVEYLSLAGLALVVWFVAPALAFVLFILLTWFHWGQGDLHSLLELQGARHLQSRWQRGLTVVVRGALPMLIPLIAFPDVYQEVASGLIHWFAPEAERTLRWIADETFRLAGASIFGFVAVASLVAGWMRIDRHRSGWVVDAGETALLTAYFSLVHPVWAIGMYFCCWHATRHFARLVESDPFSRTLAQKQHWTRLGRRIASQAAPTTVAAVGMGLAIYAVAPHRPDGNFVLLGLYLVLIAILTVPHVWVVCRMDREENIWTGTKT